MRALCRGWNESKYSVVVVSDPVTQVSATDACFSSRENSMIFLIAKLGSFTTTFESLFAQEGIKSVLGTHLKEKRYILCCANFSATLWTAWRLLSHKHWTMIHRSWSGKKFSSRCQANAKISLDNKLPFTPTKADRQPYLILTHSLLCEKFCPYYIRQKRGDKSTFNDSNEEIFRKIPAKAAYISL